MIIMPTIDPDLTIGAVALSVTDLARSLDYYQQRIGLKMVDESAEFIHLGTAQQSLLKLRKAPAKHPVDASNSGLYHFALLLPTRLALAQTIQHLVNSGTPIGGASDHHVSEALYLTDPDGHGIEIYRDRPRDQWLDENGQFLLTTKRMDVDGVMATLVGNQDEWNGLHADTVMGHVHLQVRDWAESEQFYTQQLGFDTMAHYPQAAFISAGGYHHHIGMNTWHSRGRGLADADHAQLLSYELVFSDGEKLIEAVKLNQLELQEVGQSCSLVDPNGIQVLLNANTE